MVAKIKTIKRCAFGWPQRYDFDPQNDARCVNSEASYFDTHACKRSVRLKLESTGFIFRFLVIIGIPVNSGNRSKSGCAPGERDAAASASRSERGERFAVRCAKSRYGSSAISFAASASVQARVVRVRTLPSTPCAIANLAT